MTCINLSQGRILHKVIVATRAYMHVRHIVHGVLAKKLTSPVALIKSGDALDVSAQQDMNN